VGLAKALVNGRRTKQRFRVRHVARAPQLAEPGRRSRHAAATQGPPPYRIVPDRCTSQTKRRLRTRPRTPSARQLRVFRSSVEPMGSRDRPFPRATLSLHRPPRMHGSPTLLERFIQVLAVYIQTRARAVVTVARSGRCHTDVDSTSHRLCCACRQKAVLTIERRQKPSTPPRAFHELALTTDNVAIVNASHASPICITGAVAPTAHTPPESTRATSPTQATAVAVA